MTFPWNKKKSSANIAKDRLRIAIMTDKEFNNYPFMEDLKADIIDVVKKYITVRDVDIKKEQDGELEALSIDVQIAK
ncbi:Cell division topological specificity factor MinE [hydrothermal vent metagenome]|uniref:Cell division topological specificity factor MinE n=1 Tax=hydrothermal vent metagenome TaxID=652676 RepID=A0A1W1EKK6_9ZZZZ